MKTVAVGKGGGEQVGRPTGGQPAGSRKPVRKRNQDPQLLREREARKRERARRIERERKRAEKDAAALASKRAKRDYDIFLLSNPPHSLTQIELAKKFSISQARVSYILLHHRKGETK